MCVAPKKKGRQWASQRKVKGGKEEDGGRGEKREKKARVGTFSVGIFFPC